MDCSLSVRCCANAIYRLCARTPTSSLEEGLAHALSGEHASRARIWVPLDDHDMSGADGHGIRHSHAAGP